ncbi:MAG TPA: S8 family serine peptidase [Caulobacteraceae bacterium]|nr:S8 family serine peptidase [Caulobacteraceae bacterium]
MIRLAALLAAFGLTLVLAGSSPAAPPIESPGPDRILVMVQMPPAHYRPNSQYSDAYGDGLSQSARHRIVSRLARANALSLVDNWPMPLLGVDCFMLKVPAGRSAAVVAQALSRQPGVAWSQPLNLYHTEAATGALPAAPTRPAPPTRQWRLGDLRVAATGRGVRVAVIDSMIEVGHPQLRGQVALARNFVSDRPAAPERHGTAVAGVIAARAEEGAGITGVAPGSRLLALRACWQQGAAAAACDSISLARALEFAIAHQAEVINLSLAGPPDLLLGKLIEVAEKRHITVVAAYDPALPEGGFPASQPGVIAVADQSRGHPPAGVFAAPGHEVLTTALGGGWGLFNGSSFAAAHVSGLVALMDERRSGGALKLITNPGGAIEPCASLSRVQPSLRQCGRQTVASSHP